MKITETTEIEISFEELKQLIPEEYRHKVKTPIIDYNKEAVIFEVKE